MSPHGIAPLQGGLIRPQGMAPRATRHPVESKRVPPRPPQRLPLSILASIGEGRDADARAAAPPAIPALYQAGGGHPEATGREVKAEARGDDLAVRRSGDAASTSKAVEGGAFDACAGRRGAASGAEERIVDGFKIPAKYAHLPEKEALRRARIGVGNTGSVPWNKGRKLSTDALKKIKQKTLEAMQRPDVKAKIAGRMRRPHSAEAKEKISSAMKAHHEKVRKELGIEMTVRERAKLKREERKRELAERQAILTAEGGLAKLVKDSCRRSPKKGQAKSEAHRKKISEAIRRKWQQPSYREQMIQRIQAGQEKRLETTKINAPVREKVKGIMRQAQDELELERQRKFKEVSGVVSRLELEINSLEAQRFIHSAEKDVETVEEIDKVLEESRGVLKQVKDLLEPLTRELGASTAEADSANNNGNGFTASSDPGSNSTEDWNNSVGFRKLL